jgi:glycine betaine/proline transport system ATP-binding protein
VIDNVAFGLEVQGMGKKERQKRAEEVLKLVGLEDVANQFPDQLSGGMQQRVGVARAFACEPGRDALRRAVQRARPAHPPRHAGRGHATAARDRQDDDVHHARPPEALRLGDRIAIMRDGAIVQLGTAEELVGSPADEYVENFTRDIARSHVLTLRWIMRDPQPEDSTDGPKLDVRTTMRRALPALAASSLPVCCVEDDRIVGIVDRDAVLRAIAEEEG